MRFDWIRFAKTYGQDGFTTPAPQQPTPQEVLHTPQIEFEFSDGPSDAESGQAIYDTLRHGLIEETNAPVFKLVEEGEDLFTFSAAPQDDADTVIQLEKGSDKLDLRAFGITCWADLQGRLIEIEDGRAWQIDLGETRIRIDLPEPQQGLSEADFYFG